MGVMKFRTYRNTDLTVSEVGFGLWTISTGWWGTYTECEALALMHKAFDLVQSRIISAAVKRSSQRSFVASSQAH